MGSIRGGVRDQGAEMGLGTHKVGGVGSGSNSSPWISCSAVRTILLTLALWVVGFELVHKIKAYRILITGKIFQ